MPFGLSFPELLIILVALLLLFGAKRLPEMGRGLGKGMREFKDAVTGSDETTAPPASAPTNAPPAELPAAPAEPTAQRAEAEQGERERIS